MQGAKTNAKTLDYYPIVEEIFREVSRQAGTKLPILAKAKETTFSIEEPLIDQEKEEDYELNLYISTFVSKETLVEGPGRLQIIIKPLTTQREETHTEKQVTNPAEENLILTQEPRGEIETENPEYATTKENITKFSKEIAASRKRKKTQQQQQGKGKHKLIIT